MKLKIDENSAVVVKDGKPIYVDESGKEIAFDYEHTIATIARLNAESRGHRERAEAAETAIKAFEGIEDPNKAREALDVMSKLDSKQLLDAGKVDEIRAEAKKVYDDQVKALEDRYKPVARERDSLRTALHQEIVGGSFSRSKFIADKLAVPADLVQSRFGSAYSVEDGKLVAKDPHGNRIFSRSRPGELAEFEEALEMLVDAYPHRDSILRGSGASGGGASQGQSPTAGGKRTVTRAQFDDMSAMEKMAAAKEATIVD